MLAYFHRLGFNTGFPDSRVDHLMTLPPDYSRGGYVSHGGLEYLGYTHRQRKTFDRSVEVIKDPWGEKTEELITKRGITFDNSLLMTRDSAASAKSQRLMAEKKGKHGPEMIKKIAAKRNDAHKADAVRWLKENTRLYVVEFPRCVTDFEYLWVQIHPLVGGRVTKSQADKVWQQLRNRSYVRFN